MTVSNFVAISKGDNLNITEYDQNGTRTASMPDGLYDTSTLNYTSLGRQQRDNTFEDQNRLKLEGTLVVSEIRFFIFLDP